MWLSSLSNRRRADLGLDPTALLFAQLRFSHADPHHHCIADQHRLGNTKLQCQGIQASQVIGSQLETDFLGEHEGANDMCAAPLAPAFLLVSGGCLEPDS